MGGPDGGGGGSWADLARLCSSAEAAAEAGHLDEAQALYAVVRAREPGHPVATRGAAGVLRRRARELERRGRIENAHHLDREAQGLEAAATALGPGGPRGALVRRARERAAAGDLESARELLEKGVRDAVRERRLDDLARDLEAAGSDGSWDILVARAVLTAQPDPERAADLAPLLRGGGPRTRATFDAGVDLDDAEPDGPEPADPDITPSSSVTLAAPLEDGPASAGAQVEGGMVFESHAGGLPPLKPYLAEIWRRRQFVPHMARAKLKAQNADTLAGRLWTLLNPILLALIYFVLVAVLLRAQSDTTVYLGSLLSGLFAFFYTGNAMRMGAASVVGAGNLVMNTAFPRLLLPLSACMSALLLFLPMLLVYATFHLATGLPLGPQLAAVPLIMGLQTGLSAGLAMLIAVANVFVRDVGRALPYALRMWLYMSPVLWTIDQVPDSAARIVEFSPLYPILATWHQVLIDGEGPDGWLLLQAGGWATVALVAGATLFMRKERDFAVRL